MAADAAGGRLAVGLYAVPPAAPLTALHHSVAGAAGVVTGRSPATDRGRALAHGPLALPAAAGARSAAPRRIGPGCAVSSGHAVLASPRSSCSDVEVHCRAHHAAGVTGLHGLQASFFHAASSTSVGLVGVDDGLHPIQSVVPVDADDGVLPVPGGVGPVGHPEEVDELA